MTDMVRGVLVVLAMVVLAWIYLAADGWFS